MNSFVEWLTANPAAFVGCALLALVVCVAPLYILVRRQRKSIGASVAALEVLISESLRDIRETTSVERQQDREEMGNNLRGMSDSIVRIMGEMSRTLQQQLDSFGGQIRAMSRTEEERMDRMRQNIEEKLNDYDRQMTRVGQMIDEKLSANERRIAEMRQTLSDSIGKLQAENDKKLEQIRVTVDEKLNATLDKRLGESFRSVSDRLEQVYKGLGEMQTLAVGVGDLKRVLTSVKTRGIWGEVQLGSVLQQVLTPGQYETNVQIKPGNAGRVEYAICLPGKDADGAGVYLPIDAKFPVEDYQT
ncbi:MAG: DNA recombination protein RmuC, partial [Clostridia bacterium]|nr:DNA recombination protein RmuC [Clostridia bacterium]